MVKIIKALTVLLLVPLIASGQAFRLSDVSFVGQFAATVAPPAAPVAAAGVGTSTTAFSANWAASSGATSYRLDVFTDFAMTSYVSGFNDLNVGNVTTYSVTGLTGLTAYYYRVRAANSGGTSANSSEISIGTLFVTVGDVKCVNNNATLTLNIRIKKNGANWHTPGTLAPGATSVTSEGGGFAGVTVTVDDQFGVMGFGTPVAGLTSGGVFFWQ